MFFPDLATECQVDSGPHVRAVGWLDGSHPFNKGQASPEFIRVLRSHVATAWQPIVTMGLHFCELCRNYDERPGGSANVWIPSMKNVYVVPELIVHYIEVHRYQPPDEFVAAVLACPPQGSAQFLAAVRGLTSWKPAE